MKASTKVPRNFLLLEALNKSGNYTHISYGLVDEDENDKELKNNYAKMEYWNCTLTYDDGELNLFEVRCKCTPNFPNERPILTFSPQSMLHKKIKKICDINGNLTENAVKLINWGPDMSFGDYLSTVQRIIS